jgi:inorganic pyrophosphatase
VAESPQFHSISLQYLISRHAFILKGLNAFRTGRTTFCKTVGMKLTSIPAFAGNDTINAIIETPAGSRNKYAYDADYGCFRLRKVLPEGTAFPLHFGFIPQTEADDGDPVDVLVLMDQKTFPGCLVECRVIGVIEGIQKEKGQKPERNDRIIAVPCDQKSIKTISDLGREWLDDLIHFFQYYNKREGKTFESAGTKNADRALKLIKKQLLA